MKRVILSVTNDLYSDQRLEKVCNSLVEMGFDVLLVGRRYTDSPTLPERKFATHRMRLLFRHGFLFYAEYNLRLFFYLLFKKCDLLVANDLDTLLPNYIVSRIRRKRIIYDSHEYFCGLPELNGRPRVRNFWHRIEQHCFPQLPDVITVCQSIAEMYDKEYPQRSGEKVRVVRNVPLRSRQPVTLGRADLGLPEEGRLIVMQGAINRDRGAEELILAMHHIENATLLIIGNGDVIPALHSLVKAENLDKKVMFLPRMAPEQLANYTALCDVGCSLEKDTNLNYRYCLPNKLFDYLKAGIPAVVSDLPEMARIIRESGAGLTVSDITPEKIAETIHRLLSDSDLYNSCKRNALAAADTYCWENEVEILREIYLSPSPQKTKATF
ncbi:MAG: glycosyltransferase [Bacteroidales bacterium]|nr:glycosyltransferase [Bacteroidales bacterium]